MSMATPPTSSLRFLKPTGEPLEAPREWERCLIEIDRPPEELAEVRLLRQGEPLRLVAQELWGQVRLVAEWPVSGTGRYRLTLEHDTTPDALEVTVAPRKISPEAYAQLVDDLQTRLPASVAIGLQRGGALSALELRPPGESTLAQELARLRIAVAGSSTTPGLVATLEAIARDPHQILRKREEWVVRDRVRRLEPVGLIAAIRQPNNLDPELQLPERAPDVRVEQSVDVYENRLLRSFHDEVAARLRRLTAALEAAQRSSPWGQRPSPALTEVKDLVVRLQRSRQAAGFLDDVAQLGQLPTKVSMVLLKRREYRSMLEAYLRFRRSAFVLLDEPALETPLEELPDLYELWGTLLVIETLLEVAVEAGYVVEQQQLATHLNGGIYLKVLADGETALELRHPVTDTTAKLIPQRRYISTASDGLRSISFWQIPDISVDISHDDQRRLLIFDPKYKLRSEEDAEPGDGKPKKIDIDTMHAYRDAIRTTTDDRIITYAAILYPGPEFRYGDGIEALSARPLEPDVLQARVREVLTNALTVPTTPQLAALASDEDEASAHPVG